MAVEDVLALATRHLHGVRRAGNQNVMAFCPFHANHHTPAFCLSLVSGLWICFSCKRTGNLEQLLRELGVPGSTIHTQYRYVIEEAAQHRSPRFDPLRPQIISEEPLPEGFLGLFDLCPIALLDEGFSPDVLQSFDVGFDQVHHRITYPLRDLRGSLVGISGRSVIGDDSRYKVYDTEYKHWQLPPRDAQKDKSAAVLCNGHRIYKEVFNRTNASIVLVEGFKACMWLTQLGVENVVALMGSYMSDRQRWLLERLGAAVYIMLDNDEAGQRATYRFTDPRGRYHPGIPEQLSSSLPVRIAAYDKRQPSDLAQDEAIEALRQAKDYHLWAATRE
jgi:hypothetical protein